ncbi:MAG: dephospho-CoA kinase [Raoultibacter sp.]|jgi:dephospho-CoA kinase
METILIIGGIGSGKSTVTRYFAERGAPTLDLDLLGHQALALPEAKNRLVEAFGSEILDESGEIIRKKLAACAFVTPATTRLLSDITAPFIISLMKQWVEEQTEKKNSLAFVEVSAFDGPDGRYGKLSSSIIAVTAPVELRVERAVAKGFDREDVLHRIERQPSDDERRTWAQYVVENAGDFEELTAKLDLLWEELNL